MPYVASITSVLSGHLGWHRARLKFMARFTMALLQRRSADLWQIALALKADVQLKSNYRRIQRFLSEYEVDFTTLGRLLATLLPETAPHVVVLDRTEWHFGSSPVNVLTIGIAHEDMHESMAVPIAWSVSDEDGSSAADGQIQVLERFLQVIDPSDIDVMLADREFISVQWLQALREREIPFAVRLRSDRRIGDAPDGPALPIPIKS
jgi:uncharacterized protein (UPF0216 family)